MARLLTPLLCIAALTSGTSACIVRVPGPPPPGYVVTRRAPAPVVIYSHNACARRVWVGGYADRWGRYHDGYWRCGY